MTKQLALWFMIAYQIITSLLILCLCGILQRNGNISYKRTDIHQIRVTEHCKHNRTNSYSGCKFCLSFNERARIFYDENPVNYSNVNTWGKFKIAFGIGISEKEKKNGKLIFNLEYCGFSTFITPIDGFDRILPRWVSSKHKISAPTPYKFGRDPISSVNLYGSIRSKFFIENGRDGAPVSLAKYNSKTKEIIYINSEIEFISIAKKLVKIK